MFELFELFQVGVVVEMPDICIMSADGFANLEPNGTEHDISMFVLLCCFR